MSTVAVTAPVEGYNGTVVGQTFVNGKAEVDDADLAALSYFARAGYQVGDARPFRVGEDEPADPRDTTETKLGTPLRDAAVDPQPEDFLAPTNAGQANPHGPRVVSPGIHAVEPPPLVPGPVHSDPRAQDRVERDAALAALTDEPTSEAEPDAEPTPTRRKRR